MDLETYKQSFGRASKQNQVFLVLEDGEWHCRNHEYGHIHTTQLAGSGGIKGLKNGARNRVGIKIESEDRICRECGNKTRHDRWTGEFIEPSHYTNISKDLAERIYDVLGKKDIVDNSTRPLTQITIDHKLPRLRWDSESAREQSDYGGITDDEIRQRFQLLKKSNGSVSHNLLKSRACEHCFETGNRGEPFGIRYFYAGNHRWGGTHDKDPNGCIGCGWYDIAAWRDSLNAKLNG